MGWAEHRIEEYQQGKPATWLERRILEHANPVHFILAMIALVGFVYGLWMHDWLWIGGSVILSLIGHVYCWLWTERQPDSPRTPVSSGPSR